MNSDLHKIISQKFAHLGALQKVQTLSGGSINEAYRFNFEKQSVFVKHQPEGDLPQFFSKETAGLELLAQSPFALPKILTFCDDGPAYLALSFEESGTKATDFERSFGVNLAAMHRLSDTKFGLNTWNYIGKLKQENQQHNNWPEFFASQRILPLVRLARNKGFFSARFLTQVDGLLSRVEKWVPQEPPALLHGDLWSGNYHVNSEGKPMLIDPAVYYGHREMDLAMMHLFGGFPKAIFEGYNQAYPLEPGWKERLDLHNLYPILVHVNLFGGSYAQQAQSIVERYR
jgi:fructosamine-3-kinase